MITNKIATQRATRQVAQATENKIAPPPIQTAPTTLPFSTAHALFAMPAQLGLTQKEFCQVFGLHYGDFRKLKCGHSEMGTVRFTRMMSILGQVDAMIKKIHTTRVSAADLDVAKALDILQKKRAACELHWQKWSKRHTRLKEAIARIELGINVLHRAKSHRTDTRARDLIRGRLTIRMTQLQTQLHSAEEQLAKLDHRLARYRREENELREKWEHPIPKKRSRALARASYLS